MLQDRHGRGDRGAGVPIGELARRVGVSTRTLRHYDAIGLLPPSSTDHAGRRFYDDASVAALLRIVAYRSLGLSLETIGGLLAQDTPAAEALAEHAHLLQERIALLQRQLASVTTALESLREGADIMTSSTFDGFDPEIFEEEVTERWGAEAYRSSMATWTSMSPEEKEAELALQQSLVGAFAAAAERGLDPASDEVAGICRRHVAWLGRYTTPTAPYVRSLAAMYAEDPRFDATYRGHGAFVRDALVAFVDAGGMEPPR